MKYLENSGNDYICKAFKLNIYVPAYYFLSNMAEELGDQIDTIGILYIEAFEAEGMPPEIWQLSCPVYLHMLISESGKATRAFGNHKTPEDYRVFTVYKGNVVFKDAINIQNPKAADAFLNFVLNGKIPEDIEYSKLPESMIGNLQFNGVKVGLPMMLVELMMGELARDATDETVPFRKVAGRTGAQSGYEAARLNDLPNMVSTFSGLAFQNIGDAILSGCVASKAGKKQIRPITEDLLYY